MLFSSELFLFIFLPLVFAAYRLMRGIRAKNILLTLASLVFYAWGQPVYVLILLFSVVCNYLTGLALMSSGSRAGKKAALAVSIAVNLGLLCTFKYLDFITLNVNMLLGLQLSLPGLTLPIGISFFTFQGMSYVIDIYRDRELGSRSFLKILLYISLFPQLVAGPIIKYHDISDYLDNRSTSPSLTVEGIRCFVIGLSKKLLLANTLGSAADAVFALTASQMDTRLAWLGALSYTLQIYFDFSGYSDMAIGLGKMFGFRFKENFNHPLVSASLTEFWQRWHISLSTWFREYLYIPLGGNRGGKLRTGLNKFLVFLVSGLWHGASWNFVIWGAYHGALTLTEFFAVKKKLSVDKFSLRRIPGIIYTLLAVVVGFVIFRAENMSQAWLVLSGMFGAFSQNAASVGLWKTLATPLLVLTFAAAIIASTDIKAAFSARLKHTGNRVRTASRLTGLACTLALYALCLMNLASTSFNPFIYFQF